MLKLIKKLGAFFKARLNTFQKVLTVLGCITGLVASIVLVVTGFAAIPFTGGGSLLPTWIGISLFIVLITGTFGSAGKYLGMSIDTVLDKEKPNNEKIATFAGCLIGMIVSILAIPLHYVGLAFIVQNASLAVWQLALPFIPITIGMFGSSCAKIGKAIDACTDGKTIFDLFKSKKNTINDLQNAPGNVPALVATTQQLSIPESKHAKKRPRKPALRKSVSMPNIYAQLSYHHTSIDQDNMKLPRLKKVTTFESGINDYLSMPRYKNTHLNFFSKHLDNDRGVIRANVYKALFSKACSNFQKKVIAYSLFASHDGKTLQKQLCKKMRYQSVKVAKKTLKSAIKKEATLASKIKILNEFVIKPIVVNANTKVSFSSGAYDEALDVLKTQDLTTRHRF